VTPARRIAYEILGSVERGGQAAGLLDERLTGLEARDAGLATQIVFGVLRRLAQLDWLIHQAAARPLEKIDSSVLRALRMGAFQLRFLDRVPPHAAVAESVELVKRAGKSSAAGFANAVLRRLPPLPDAWPSEDIRYSMPEWLWRRWRVSLGPDLAAAAARASLEEPEPYTRDGRRMDAGAQSVVPLLDLQPGQLFLDLCAAPGNKTLQALETPVRAIACDSNPRRLRAFLAPCPRVRLDAALPLPFPPVFDRILVDAPCSGTGTLARNPEIRWRLTPAEIVRQSQRQRAILASALACLRPGGRLVYSTCSLEPEENEEVVKRVAGSRVQSTVVRVPGRDPGDGFFAAVIE
jgi:16S rRNA (cytosine967-C5)-methyltransferase